MGEVKRRTKPSAEPGCNPSSPGRKRTVSPSLMVVPEVLNSTLGLKSRDGELGDPQPCIPARMNAIAIVTERPSRVKPHDQTPFGFREGENDFTISHELLDKSGACTFASGVGGEG